MLTPEQNDLVCRSGPGTPLGQLFRQYWLPVALETDVPDDRPLPVAALHQQFVLFRDEQKRLGLLDMLFIDVPLFAGATASVCSFYAFAQRQVYPAGHLPAEVFYHRIFLLIFQQGH